MTALVVAGKLVVDEVLVCGVPLTPGSSQRAVARSLDGGGQVWHTALAARRAGAAVTVCGWCGTGADTDALRQRLRTSGVVDRLAVAGEATRAVVLVEPSGERTIVSTGGRAHLDAVDLAVLDDARWLHVDGAALDDRSGGALLALARAAAVPVSLEPPALASLASRAPWLAALPRLDALLGRPDEIEAVLPLLVAPPLVTVAHAGPEPVTTRSRDGVVTTPVPDRPVDTTGAGDRFAGGWLAARLAGAGPAAAAQAGVAAATRS